jgi:hypothetical protein
MIEMWIRPLLIILLSLGVFAHVSSFTLYTGETLPLRNVVQQQMANLETLYRPRYGNRDVQFKTLSIEMRQPEVIAIGSSRVLQFRAGFFNRSPGTFYNAAGPGWRLSHVEQVLYSLEPEAHPRVIVLAIDPPWFNNNFRGESFPPSRTDFEHLVFANNALLRDLRAGVSVTRGGFSFSQYRDRRIPATHSLALGMRAIRDGHGFRSDGSELYGDHLVARWLNMSNTRDAHFVWMREGREMYVYGDTVDHHTMTSLSHLLAWAVDHDITIVGFLPSYMPSLWTQMNARGQHNYMNVLSADLERLFAAYEFPFFDFSDGRRANTADWEFFDGWHASELGNLRLYIQMAETRPDILGAYSDLDRLRAIARSAQSTWDVFGLDGLR